jgi:hypothetical protein
MLPDRIFFTGVPGSRWSSIAQILEIHPDFNTSDRTDWREYNNNTFSGHKGAYFGRGMEFEPTLDSEVIDSAHIRRGGTRIIKSHDWAYMLDDIKAEYEDDWIMLVYRPDLPSYAWWHQAGGFNIPYPDYTEYENSVTMLHEISAQNDAILKFAAKHNAQWSHFNKQFIGRHFYFDCDVDFPHYDILVTIIK